uniref:Uncharacterized protein n=1 Tax=Oryza brachyantha TaxID=4533 RepID=J3MGV0_ORYBR
MRSRRRHGWKCRKKKRLRPSLASSSQTLNRSNCMLLYGPSSDTTRIDQQYSVDVQTKLGGK